MIETRSSPVVQQVKDPMLSLQRLKPLLWNRFDAWPRNFHMLRAWEKNDRDSLQCCTPHGENQTRVVLYLKAREDCLQSSWQVRFSEKAEEAIWQNAFIKWLLQDIRGTSMEKQMLLHSSAASRSFTLHLGKSRDVHIMNQLLTWTQDIHERELLDEFGSVKTLVTEKNVLFSFGRWLNCEPQRRMKKVIGIRSDRQGRRKDTATWIKEIALECE